MILLLLAVFGLALAEEYPVANKDNCTVGQRFVIYPGSPFVNECVKFGRGNHVKFVGCAIGNRLIPLGGKEDDVSAESTSGSRYSCYEDKNGINKDVVACVIKGKAIDIGSTGKIVDEKNDRGYLVRCKRDEKGIRATREGCYLAPDTADDVFLKVDEIKPVSQIGQYCKYAYKGYGVACGPTKDIVKDL